MRCNNDPKTIAGLNMQFAVTDLNPVYQRQGGVWPTSKQQLLIDSILNGYDIPKIYLHDFSRANQANHFAVVDGKQRLLAIRNFLADEFEIPADITFTGNPPPGAAPEDLGGSLFSQLPEEWRVWFNGQSLTIVLIETDDLDEIEDLFFRLNNGEPLKAAEKRNAMGGRMCEMIREVAQHDFFTDKLPFVNNRYNHYEIAAKFILMEKTEQNTNNMYTDLKKRFLDTLVDENRELPEVHYNRLLRRVTTVLDEMCRIFNDGDPLLSKQSYPQIYYLFWKFMKKTYTVGNMKRRIHTFLEDFTVLRQENNAIEIIENRDPSLVQYGRLSSAGTNDSGSLRTRVGILLSQFLANNPETSPRNTNRQFNDAERLAIWFRAGKMCEECGSEVIWEDMDADHHQRWVDGGATTFANGRCLHANCNRALP